MIKKLLILTEGAPNIGLGHIVECKAIVDIWTDHGGLEEYLFAVNDDAGAIKYLESNDINFEVVANSEIPQEKLVSRYDAVLFNKLKPEYEALKELKRVSKKLIVIDFQGNSKITADYLVNFSIDKRRHEYCFPDSSTETFFGPQYFPVGKSLLKALDLPRPVNSKSIIVSMGGYDNSRTTDKVIKALKGFDNFQKEIILGPGFDIDDNFKNLMKSLDGSFEFLKNVSDLPQRIRKSEFLINAGGNTVYEAAILGVPVLVIGEIDFEVEQGRAFAQAGMAVNIESGKDCCVQDIKTGIDKVIAGEFRFDSLQSVKFMYEYI